jgi:hypothetical protein
LHGHGGAKTLCCSEKFALHVPTSRNPHIDLKFLAPLLFVAPDVALFARTASRAAVAVSQDLSHVILAGDLLTRGFRLQAHAEIASAILGRRIPAAGF